MSRAVAFDRLFAGPGPELVKSCLYTAAQPGPGPVIRPVKHDIGMWPDLTHGNDDRPLFMHEAGRRYIREDLCNRSDLEQVPVRGDA